MNDRFPLPCRTTGSPRRRAVGASALVAALMVVVAAPAARGASPAADRIGPDGTFLHVVRHPSTVVVDSGAPCRAVVAAGVSQCGVSTASAGSLLYTVAPGPQAPDGLASRPWTVTVYRMASAPSTASTALATTPEDGNAGPLFANVTARPANLAARGQPSLVVGYRAEGTADLLSVDVIVGATPRPRVVAHLDLQKGSAVLRAGRLVTYAADYQPGDANCCPRFVQRDELALRGRSLVLTRRTRLRTAHAHQPPGDLD